MTKHDMWDCARQRGAVTTRVYLGTLGAILLCASLGGCRTSPTVAAPATAGMAAPEETALGPTRNVEWAEPVHAAPRFARRLERNAPRLTRRTAEVPVAYGLTIMPKAEDVLDEEVQEADDAGADDKPDLAKASQNPLADLISVPFQDNINLGAGPFDRTTNVLNIQPVVPIKLTPQWNLVTRTIIPVISQGHVESSDGTTSGLGDISPTAWLTPAKPGKLIWGVGASLALPTATDDRLGSGKWSAGPSIVVLAMPGKWVLGGLAAQTWSFAGDDSRDDVNLFFSQIFVNYNLPCGWFLTSAPIITANWNAKGEKWTLPAGAGFGRVMKVGKQPINWSVHAYYNAVKPEFAADWQLRLQLALLFPK